MTPIAIVLILLSAFMHAFWNLLARRQRSEMVFIGRMLTVVVIAGAVPAVVGELAARGIPGRAWLCLAVSGTFCGVYFYFLAKAYESSDFTTVYPVARALPVLLVALGDVVRGRLPSTTGWIGMLLVAAGCFLAPLRSIRDFHLRAYLHRAGIWMVLTALATVGYSLSDKIGVELVATHAGSVGEAVISAARYGYFFFAVAGLVFLAMRRIWIPARPEAHDVGWRIPALAGLLNYACYWLVLWAFQLSRRASYVVTFRQFSIIIGVMLAFAIYREKGVAVRLTGAIMITIGLVLVALWGG